MAKIRLTRDISENQFRWRNDSRVNDFTRQNGLISQEDMRSWKEKISKDPSIIMFGGICEESDFPEDVGKNVLTCGLTGISLIHGTAEFSLLVGPEHHKKGYGREALKALISYGFLNLRLNLIWGETFAHNHALNLFKSIGMKEEARLRERYFKNGQFLDTFIVSIKANEWIQ